MRDQEIIENWFHLYQAYVTNFLVYYTGDRDVEDYVQEVFIRAFRKLNSFQSNSNPKTWLISIARNLVVDMYRKDRLTTLVQLNKAKRLSTVQNPIEDEIILKEEYKRVINHITNLKQQYREVIVLRGIMDLPVKECSEILKWSENKVNVTFHRALGKLRVQLKREEEISYESKQSR